MKSIFHIIVSAGVWVFATSLSLSLSHVYLFSEEYFKCYFDLKMMKELSSEASNGLIFLLATKNLGMIPLVLVTLPPWISLMPTAQVSDLLPEASTDGVRMLLVGGRHTHVEWVELPDFALGVLTGGIYQEKLYLEVQCTEVT